MKLRLSDTLRMAYVGDAVFLMDIRRGEYYGMDAASAALLLDFIERGEAGAPNTRGLVEAARKRGWLTETPHRAVGIKPPGARRPKTPNLRLALRCILEVVLYMRFSGFGSAYARVTATDRACPVGLGPAQQLNKAIRAIALAETLIVHRLGARDCLPRSLALFAFLRRCGLPVRHCIGIQRYPFIAHAWVEFEGQPVRERPETIRQFTLIATIGS